MKAIAAAAIALVITAGVASGAKKQDADLFRTVKNASGKATRFVAKPRCQFVK
jgi:hypothetical protein